MEYDLQRFLKAQNQVYLKALSEIKNGKKESHWMWFIFPQIKGLSQSETADFYAIADLQEAKEYLSHPVLGMHLIEITKQLLTVQNKSANEIFGYPDDWKLRSSMTLFANVDNSNLLFSEVLKQYFNGVQDERTLELLRKS